MFLGVGDNLAQSGGDKLKLLHGWSIDLTLAAIPGINIEFGEVYDPNSNQVVKFFSYGFAAGVEASASFNKVTIYPYKGFEVTDLEGYSTGWTFGGPLSYSRSRNTKQPYGVTKKFDTYLMIKFGSGYGAGGTFMPKHRTSTYQWDWFWFLEEN